MIGILYTTYKRRICTQRLNYLFKRSGQENCEPIIAFSISDINLKNKMVVGDIISENHIKSVKVPLPSVVFNLALCKDKNSIRRLRYLTLLKDVVLINSVNKFDQWMIMEMASCSPNIKRYFLPYHIYDKAERDFKPDDSLSYIAIPARGSSLSRIIYTRFNSKTGKLEGNQFFKKGHICDYIDASLCQKRWIFIELPNILTCDNMPIVTRIYLQKVYDSKWEIIGKDVKLNSQYDMGRFIKPMSNASLNIINFISNFLPNLGCCFIDFLIGNDGAPYFLHLGGLDHHFLYDSRDINMYSEFFSNIISLTDYYNHV